MFFLNDTPDNEGFQNLAERYEEMDINSVRATVNLLRVGSRLLTAFESFLGRYGLSQGRFLVLIVLNRDLEKPMSASELSQKVGVTRATMTGLLDNLEKEQLIWRYHDKKDRRKINLQLTHSAKKLLGNILPDYWRRISLLMSPLTEQEKDNLTEMVKLIESNIDILTKPI
jgi:MarR family transcriptional regulator, negative regulator of the multidrug operon emrRAB